MRSEGDIFSGLGEQKGKQQFEEVAENLSDESNKSCGKEDFNCKRGFMDGVRIIPLKGELNSLSKKKKFRNFFAQIHLSQHTAHFVGEEFLRELLSQKRNDEMESGVVSVESSKYLFALSENQRKEINAKILSLASTNDLLPVHTNDKIQADNMSFIKFNAP